jgi:putative flippase GtrA
MARLNPGLAFKMDARFLRFLVIGTLNTAFSYSLYALGLYLGLPFYLASLVALILGIFFSFFTQGRFVFDVPLQGRFPRFVAIWMLIYVVNILVIRFIAIFDVNYYLAGMLALVPTTLLSFFLQRYLVFQESDNTIDS